MTCNTWENSVRVPGHNTTGTFTVVGASHFPIGRSSSLTTVGSVTVSSLARSASNVNCTWCAISSFDIALPIVVGGRDVDRKVFD